MSTGPSPLRSPLVIGVILLLLLQSMGCLFQDQTKVVQLTDGPLTIVRDRDSILLREDLLLYSRTGLVKVKDNASGVMKNVWDNGTFVKDLSDGKEDQISDSILRARMSHGNVVWLEDDDIIVHNFYTKESAILPVPEAKPLFRPDIHKDYIVWADHRNDPVRKDDDIRVDIYLYNLSTELEFRLTDNKSDKGAPSIWNDIVAWADDRNGNFDIYALNLSNGTEFRVTTDPNVQLSPKVSSRAISWTTSRISGLTWQEDIMYLDLLTGEERRASRTGAIESYDLWGDRIVWEDTSKEDRPHESGDIYIHNISKNKTKPYFSSSWSQWSPSVEGRKVVWVDNVGGGGEIFTKELVEKPVYGLDYITLAVLVAVTVMVLSGIGAYRYRLVKEEREIKEEKEKKAKKEKQR